MIKVLLAEDHVILRDGLKALLKEDPEIDVIAEAGNGKEVVEILEKTAVDLIIVDIDMPEMDGIETTIYVKKHYSSINVMVLSMLEDEKYVLNSYSAGALGYVLKTTGKDELISAIKTVAHGNPYISHKISVKMINKILEFSPFAYQNKDYGLSDRELEVLNFIAEGYTNTEIADKIFTSKRTVETHRKSLMEKTGTKNTATLIKFAVLNRIIK